MSSTCCHIFGCFGNFFGLNPEPAKLQGHVSPPTLYHYIGALLPHQRGPCLLQRKMSKSLFLVLLLGASCGLAQAGLYSASGPVVELTASNMEAKIKAAGLMLVEVRGRLPANGITQSCPLA